MGTERVKERIVLSQKKAKGLLMIAAGASFLLSVYLWFRGQRDEGLFVGLWVPSILSLGALAFAGKGGRTAS